MPKTSSTLVRWLIALMAVGIVAACSDTWSGVKKDTKDNVEATGEAMQKTGEAIEDSVKDEEPTK